MSINGKAVVILIDNSPGSIDSDFYPNRLEAQKVAIERLTTYLFSICSYSQVSLITMSSDEFGIRTSFTSTSSKISSILRNIHSTSSISQNAQNSSNEKLKIYCPLLLEKSLKTALIAIEHFQYPSSNDQLFDLISNKKSNEPLNMPHIEKQIIAFICSRHDIDTDQKVEDIKKSALSKDTTINIVSFGMNVNDKDLLRNLTQTDNSEPNINIESSSIKKTSTSNSDKKTKETNNSNQSNSSLSFNSGEFIDIPSPSDKILSDVVLSSKIGIGNIKPQIPVKSLIRSNPDLFEAVYDSLLTYKQQAGDEIDSSVEHQIQMLESCAFSTPKTPQRTNLKSKVTIPPTLSSLSPITIQSKNNENSTDRKTNLDFDSTTNEQNK